MEWPCNGVQLLNITHKLADYKLHPASNNVLIPLTNSLYVSGEITKGDTVLVDIGTGFLIEKVWW